MIEYINGMKLIKGLQHGEQVLPEVFLPPIHEENAMWNETSRRMGPPYAAFVVIIECGMLLMVPLGGMFFPERLPDGQRLSAVSSMWVPCT